MAPTTQPHGFITTTGLEYQYRRAHIKDYVPGMHDSKEYDTVELLEDIFNKVIWRNSDDVHISSQQPPGVQTDKTCDIVVRYEDKHSEGGDEKRLLCFVKCKQAEDVMTYRLDEVERHALDYCKEYLASRPGLDFVYAAHLRLWEFRRNVEELRPLWGSQKEESWAEYKDVGADVDAEEIRMAFRSIVGTDSVLGRLM